MEKNISNKIENLIKTKSPKKSRINDFIQADRDYQKLIQKGLTMKRGFNIMTTEEIHNPALNCACSQSTQQLHS